MKLYAGLTDFDWYLEQKRNKSTEVNFWRPGNKEFKSIQPNELFLFKLKKPHYAIVGGGFYAGYASLPVDTAWDYFEIRNGVRDRRELKDKIIKYKKKNNMDLSVMKIGCIAVVETFFFEEKDWIDPMSDWSKATVQGKSYDITQGEGKRVYQQVLDRLNNSIRSENEDNIKEKRLEKYRLSMNKLRLGQGSFRMLVCDAYKGRCAVTGEDVLPVLQAAHIRSYAEDGENEVSNGILLRSDIHLLYDRGYLNIDENYCINISERLKKDYGKYSNYHELHNEKLKVIPANEKYLPNKEALKWHYDNVFMK